MSVENAVNPSVNYPPHGTLSVCIITLNEENNIEACINCIKPCADEIIVVDTGSTDNTIELAKRNGAKVHAFNWCDDFSAAKNESIKHATCDWILWLDADDRIGLEEAKLLDRLKKVSPRNIVYCFEIVSKSEKGEDPPFMQMRFFPNNLGIKFENRVHESIGKSVLEKNLEVKYTDLRVTHLGYTDPNTIQKKLSRNIKLIEMDIKDNPKNTAHLYQLAQSYSVLGKYKESINELKKIMEIPKEKQKQQYVYEHSPAEIASKYFLLGNFKESIKWADIALDFNDSNIVALYYKALVILKDNNNNPTGIALLKKIIDTNYEPNSLPIDINFFKNQARMHINNIKQI